MLDAGGDAGFVGVHPADSERDVGNPAGISVHVNKRLATVRGKLVWPKVAMAELVAGLG